MPRLRDDAEIAAGLGDDALRCGPAISGLTWSTATQAVTSSIHNCRMRLLRCTECGARNADFVVTGCGDQFSGRQIPRCRWDRQTSGRYMDTVWLLIETDETKQQGRTRTGRPVAMSLAAQLRRAARIGLLAAGLVALLITASGTGQLRAQSFNCRYARHPDERVICHDPLLGRLDEELASMYRSLLLRLPKEEGEQLYKEEDAFVILRGRCGAQRACIEESYRRRIRELEEALGKHE